jgi:hypothetical protein
MEVGLHAILNSAWDTGVWQAPRPTKSHPCIVNRFGLDTECVRQFLSSDSVSGIRMGEYVTLKCTLVQALRLCTGRTAHRVSRGISFHDHDTRKGVRGQRHIPAALYPRKRPGTEAEWAPGPVRSGAENLTLTGIRPRTVQPVASPVCSIARIILAGEKRITRRKSC